MELTPKQKRNLISTELEKYKNSQSDFYSERDAYINLNGAMARAVYAHDTKTAKIYSDDIKKMEKLSEEQDKRATWEIDEDTNKKVMTPNKSDVEFLDKFEIRKANLDLFHILQDELKKMNNEAKLCEKIKNTPKTDIEKMEILYVGLQEGIVDAKMKKGELVGKPINSERFRNNYPNATKTLEQTIEKHVEHENKKGNER